MSQSKFVSLPVDAEGKPEITPDMLSLCPDVATLGAVCLILAALPEASSDCVILNRSRLIEEIAKVIAERAHWGGPPEKPRPCFLCVSEATALLARVEDA